MTGRAARSTGDSVGIAEREATMKGFGFWHRWLLVLGMVITIFGLAMALLNATPAFGLFNDRIDPIFWGAEPLPGEAIAFRTWVYGAWGATVAGWGLLMVFVAHNSIRVREPWAWTALSAAIGLWYLFDTGISAAHGVWFNVLFNSAILLLAALSLAGIRRSRE
jgi:hypothetical protein